MWPAAAPDVLDRLKGRTQNHRSFDHNTMAPLHLTENQPHDTDRATEWGAFQPAPYVTSMMMASVSIILFGLLIDTGLIHFGVGIHPWAEATISGTLGFVFATPGVLIAWRLGLVTLLHYMLGTMVLFLPATLMSQVVYGPISLYITPPESMAEQHGGAPIIYSNFIRLMRAVVLTPVFMLTFWLFYHCIFRLRPRT